MPDEKNVQRTESDEDSETSPSPQATGDAYNTEDYLAAQFEADAERQAPVKPEAAADPYNTEDYLIAEMASDQEARPSDEDTEDMPAITDEQLESLTGRRDSSAPKSDRHEMPTLPLPEEPAAEDP